MVSKALVLCLFLVAVTALPDVVLIKTKVSLNSVEDTRMEAVVTFKNSLDTKVHFLPWGTPFDVVSPGLNFVLTRFGEKKPLVYRGIVARRLPPTASDYITLPALGSLSVTIDLSEIFDVSKAAEYKVDLLSVAVDAVVGSIEVENDFAPISVVVEGSSAFVSLSSSVPSPFEDDNSEEHGGLLGHTYSGCSASQQTSINNAFANFGILMTKSQNGLKSAQNSTTYKTWFGTYLASRFTTVDNCVNRMKTNSGNGNYLFTCSAPSCSSGTIAYVYPATSTNIYLCSTFFTIPATGPTSQADTMPHEISHFNVMCGTGDYSYGQTNCKNLAISNPANAVRNADNYAFFSVFV